jgi:hypothetical protein
MKQNPMYDPLVLTGLAMMKGGGFANAMSEAATTNYNLQQAQKIQQEQQQAQFMAQRLPQVLRDLQGKNPNEAAAMLAELNIPAQDAALILERLGIGAPNSKPMMFTGADDMQYETYKDPQTGRLVSQPIPGQQMPQPKLTNEEQKRVSAATTQRDAAKSMLDLIPKAKEAYKILQDETGSWTQPNTLLSHATTPDAQEQSTTSMVTNYAAYSAKAREAKQILSKIGSHLVQDAVKALKGSDTRGSVFLEKIMKQGIPDSNLGPKAFEQLLNEFEEAGKYAQARGGFLGQYADLKGTLNGAQSAFDETWNQNASSDNAMQEKPNDPVAKYENDRDVRGMEKALEARRRKRGEIR